MFRYCFFAVLFFLGFLFVEGRAVCACFNKEVKRISITLDDAPMAPSRLFKHPNLRALSFVEGVWQSGEDFKLGVFVVGAHLKRFGAASVNLYSRAGHIIANHSFSHPALSKTTIADFVADVKQNHGLISGFSTFQPCFRFPYLDKGAGKSQEVLKQLSAMRYENGYVTVITHDWYANKLLLDAVRGAEPLDYKKFGELYVELIVEGAEFMAQQYSDKGLPQPAHVLLLHANDVNALYFKDLLKAFKEKGWRFVDMDEAYKINEQLRKDGRFRMKQNFSFSLKSPYIYIPNITERFQLSKITLQ